MPSPILSLFRAIWFLSAGVNHGVDSAELDEDVEKIVFPTLYFGWLNNESSELEVLESDISLTMAKFKFGRPDWLPKDCGKEKNIFLRLTQSFINSARLKRDGSKMSN